MSLRSQINLIVGGTAVAMFAAVLAVELVQIRGSVREEVEAANRVAVQFVMRFGDVFGTQGIEGVEMFLRSLGRIRSNEIVLIDAAGAQRYESPPSPYRQGQNAPDWFVSLAGSPRVDRKVPLRDGSLLLLRTDPSRALLDGWHEFRRLALIGAALASIASVFAYVAARRVLRPIAQVVEGLHEASLGHFDYRVPESASGEARALSGAFNRLMQAVVERDKARESALLAEQQRDLSREMALRFERELEQERRALARDLHDDLGQHSTALKTLATTFEHRLGGREPSLAQLASLMVQSADSLLGSIRAMINRVRPEALEHGGLVFGLRALIDDWQLRRPDLRFELLLDPSDDDVFGVGPDETESAAYRIVQEAVTNAVRHSQGSTVVVSLSRSDDWLRVQVSDDGRGLPSAVVRAGKDGRGLVGMRERAAALGGEFSVRTGESGGAELLVTLPWSSRAPADDTT